MREPAARRLAVCRFTPNIVLLAGNKRSRYRDLVYVPVEIERAGIGCLFDKAIYTNPVKAGCLRERSRKAKRSACRLQMTHDPRCLGKEAPLPPYCGRPVQRRERLSVAPGSAVVRSKTSKRRRKAGSVPRHRVRRTLPRTSFSEAQESCHLTQLRR